MKPKLYLLTKEDYMKYDSERFDIFYKMSNYLKIVGLFPKRTFEPLKHKNAVIGFGEEENFPNYDIIKGKDVNELIQELKE